MKNYRFFVSVVIFVTLLSRLDANIERNDKFNDKFIEVKDIASRVKNEEQQKIKGSQEEKSLLAYDSINKQFNSKNENSTTVTYCSNPMSRLSAFVLEQLEKENDSIEGLSFSQLKSNRQRTSFIQESLKLDSISDDFNFCLIAHCANGLSNEQYNQFIEKIREYAGQNESKVISMHEIDKALVWQRLAIVNKTMGESLLSQNSQVLHDHNLNELLMASQAETEKIMIDNPEIKKIYAYHEAAHALMAVLQSNYLILSQLSLTPQGFVGGVFLASPKIDECLHDNSVEMRSYRHDERINQTKNNIMIYLAGGISHEILNGEKLSFKDFELKYRNEIGYPGLTGSDIDIVVELLKYYSIFKDFSLVSNVQNDLEQYSIPYSIPSQEERELLVNNLLEECYEDTYRILYENKDLLDKVAILALQKGIISGDIIYEMAGIKRPKYDFELSSVEKASRIIINWLSWTAKRVAFYDRHYSNLQDL